VEGAATQGDALYLRDDGVFVLANGVVLYHPELAIRPTDRIGVVGPNGSGKTSLLSEIVSNALHPERTVYIKQELTRTETHGVVEAFYELPNETRGVVLSTFARLGSEPTALLASQLPSPGEARKLALAVGLLREPYLIVMDEPTNHMDLVSVMGLEEALRSYQGALLLVSHDDRFLRELVSTRWELIDDNDRWEIRVES
jgi:macrolide transport system ATP-binding/permease protein